MALDFSFNGEPSPVSKDSLAIRRKLAASLLQQGTDTSPVRAWSQGAARLAQSLMGGLDLGMADVQESRAQKQAVEDAISGIGSGGQPPVQPPGAPPVPVARPTPQVPGAPIAPVQQATEGVTPMLQNEGGGGGAYLPSKVAAGLLTGPGAQPTGQGAPPVASALAGPPPSAPPTGVNPGMIRAMGNEFLPPAIGQVLAGQVGRQLDPYGQAGFKNLEEARHNREVENKPQVVPFGAELVSPTGALVHGASGNGLLDEKTLVGMAQQARAGDMSVYQNLGRGAQGAENIVRLRKEVDRQNAEQGVTGTDQAMRNAEFFGVKSGQRTLGNKQANIELAATEFKNVLPVVMEASKGVNRTNYPDLNKVIQMFEEKTGDPNVVKFGGGVNTLVNLYARAISPTGAATVSDKDHARLLLNRAWSQGQFEAATGMMMQEINAALNSPEAVRDAMRKRFGAGAQQTPAAGSTAPPPADPLGIR